MKLLVSTGTTGSQPVDGSLTLSLFPSLLLFSLSLALPLNLALDLSVHKVTTQTHRTLQEAFLDQVLCML